MDNIINEIKTQKKEVEQMSMANTIQEKQSEAFINTSASFEEKSDNFEKNYGIGLSDGLKNGDEATPMEVIDHIIINGNRSNYKEASEKYEIKEKNESILAKDTTENIKMSDIAKVSVSVNTDASMYKPKSLVAIIQNKLLGHACDIQSKANNEAKNESNNITNTKTAEPMEEIHTGSLNIEARIHKADNICAGKNPDNLTPETVHTKAKTTSENATLNDVATCNEKSFTKMENFINDLKKNFVGKPKEVTTCKSEHIMSDVIVPKNVQTAGLSMLAEYNSDSDHSSDEISVVEPATSKSLYRNRVVEITSESDSSDDEGSVEYLNEIRKTIDQSIDLDDDDDDETGERTKRGPPRVKGEFLIDDLPPIEDLHISVPEAECVELGKVHSIVEQLVLVNALRDSILIDLDTVLFLEKGKRVLGKVFDVLGQVSDPLYCIRFNSNQQIRERDIKTGEKVYVAPRTQYTQFVVLSSLMKNRGSDASWENDIEPPPRFLAYSDDEQERAARAKLRSQNRSNDHNIGTKRFRSGREQPMPLPVPPPSPLPPSLQPFNGHARGDVGGGNWGDQSNSRSLHNTAYPPQSYHQSNNYDRGSWHSNYPQQYIPPPPNKNNNWPERKPIITYSMQPNVVPYPAYPEASTPNYRPAPRAVIRHPPQLPSTPPSPPVYILNPYAVRPAALPPTNPFKPFRPALHPPPPPGAE